jgi:hypothetical protein
MGLGASSEAHRRMPTLATAASACMPHRGRSLRPFHRRRSRGVSPRSRVPAGSARWGTSLRASRDEGLGLSTPQPCCDRERDGARAALTKLLSEPAWRDFAIAELDRLWRNRDGLASWAAAMLTIGEAAAVLNRLAGLNEAGRCFRAGYAPSHPPIWRARLTSSPGLTTSGSRSMQTRQAGGRIWPGRAWVLPDLGGVPPSLRRRPPCDAAKAA